MIPGAEAQGAPEVGESNEERSKAVAASLIGTVSRDAISQCEFERCAMVGEYYVVLGRAEALQNADAAIGDGELECARRRPKDDQAGLG